jgi:hypothetical protein
VYLVLQYILNNLEVHNCLIVQHIFDLDILVCKADYCYTNERVRHYFHDCRMKILGNLTVFIGA